MNINSIVDRIVDHARLHSGFNAVEWYQGTCQTTIQNVVEDFIEQDLQLDIAEALAILCEEKILPCPKYVSRITPGLTPGYQAGVLMAAQVCLTRRALARLNEDGEE